MRLGSVLMFLMAVVLGMAAALFARAWLEGQVTASPRHESETLVVAAQPLRYGAELNAMNLREIAWPSDALPKGAFKKKAELLKGEKRIVLSAIEANEPILQPKITGPGQRASLSALIRPSMTAVTVRVNDVGGVGGFVLPGDYVDVLLTRVERRNDGERSYTDVLLQNVRVLGVDQIADDRAEKPVVAKAVTLEVTTEAAQKVVLATSIGRISLTLRGAGALTQATHSRIGISDLGRPSILVDAKEESKERNTDSRLIVGVTRSLKRSEYSVLPWDR